MARPVERPGLREVLGYEKFRVLRRLLSFGGVADGTGRVLAENEDWVGARSAEGVMGVHVRILGDGMKEAGPDTLLATVQVALAVAIGFDSNR